MSVDLPKIHIRLRSYSVDYRQGFLEVTSNIHGGCVNLEVWDVTPDVNLSQVAWLDDEALTESYIQGNTELELTPNEARQLANALLAAADAADRHRD